MGLVGECSSGFSIPRCGSRLSRGSVFESQMHQAHRQGSAPLHPSPGGKHLEVSEVNAFCGFGGSPTVSRYCVKVHRPTTHAGGALTYISALSFLSEPLWAPLPACILFLNQPTAFAFCLLPPSSVFCLPILSSSPVASFF